MQENAAARWVKSATMLATAVALILVVIKSVAVIYTGSMSILASMVDSIMDIGMSLVNFFAVRYALQPPDAEHRFGHGKAEHLAALAQAAFICGSALVLLYSGANRMFSSAPLQHDHFGLIVMLISTLLTLLLVLYQRWVISKTNNSVIKADMLHFSMDIITNVAVLVALLLSRMGWYWSDGLFAIIIAFYICYGALKLAMDAIQHLLDRELPEAERQRIIDCVKAVKGVCGMHDLRTRQSGANRFVQLHIELNDQLNLMQAHQISDAVELEVAALWENTHVIVHQDPQSAVVKHSGED